MEAVRHGDGAPSRDVGSIGPERAGRVPLAHVPPFHTYAPELLLSRQLVEAVLGVPPIVVGDVIQLLSS